MSFPTDGCGSGCRGAEDCQIRDESETDGGERLISLAAGAQDVTVWKCTGGILTHFTIKFIDPLFSPFIPHCQTIIL